MDSIMNIEEYNKRAIIPPPETPVENTKYTRIVIDSKDRIKSLYPYPNSYEIKLDNEVQDVISAKLISADIPLSMYMINQYFDRLTIIVNATTYNIQLEHGDYNAVDLATMMTNKLNEQFSSTFYVTYNNAKDNFTFAASISFSLVFGNGSNSLDALLGFGKQTYTSSATGSSPYNNIVRSVYRKNFHFNNCLIMYIDQFDNYKSPSVKMDRSFAIVPSIYNNLNISDYAELVKTFSPPIPRLDRLIISFLDRYGNPYDFQNVEHRFELLLTSHKQARRYTIFGN
jgi:hypothetical protein